jgi:uncharacterized protein YbjQ (UPF0145 family)
MSPEQLYRGIHDILSRLFNPPESYRRALDMLRAVHPHIFSARRRELRYLKSALLSLWKQGIRRMDRAYAGLLWNATRMDRRLGLAARREARRLRRRARKLGADGMMRVREDWARMEELIGQAQDYAVRFRPDETLEQVVAWAREVRVRARQGVLTVDDARAIYENAARYLRIQRRRHRFPGIILEGAIEAAIKGLHYERVTSAIVAGGRPGR